MSLLDKTISSSYNENKIIKRMSDLSYSALDGRRQEVINYAPEGVIMPGQISREKPLDAITKEMIKQYQEEQNVPAEVIGGVPMKYRKAGYEPLFKVPVETDTIKDEAQTIYKNSLFRANAIRELEVLLNDLDKAKKTLKRDIDVFGLTPQNSKLQAEYELATTNYTEQLKQLKKEYENDKFEIKRRIEIIKNIKRQNALAIQENKEEVQRFQNEFIQMNRNRLNIQQQPYESDMDYYNRLKAIEKEQFDPVLYKQISLNENIKQLKPKLLSLFKEDVIEDVIKGLSDQDKFILNKNFDLISKQFLSKNGFNPNISPSAAATELMNIFQEATSAAAKLQGLFKRKNVIDEGEDYATQKQAVLDLQAAFKRKKIAGKFPAVLQKYREIQQKILEGQSASKIQSVFKGHLGRKTFETKKAQEIEEIAAAEREVALLRDINERKRNAAATDIAAASAAIAEENAAATIQKAIKNKQARAQFFNALADRQERQRLALQIERQVGKERSSNELEEKFAADMYRDIAAKKLQSVYRGHLGRIQGKKYTWAELNAMSIQDLKDMLINKGYGNPDGSITATKKGVSPAQDVLIFNAWQRKLNQALSSRARSTMVEKELAQAGIIAPKGEASLPGSSALSALTTVPVSGTFTPTPTPLQDITAATKLQAAYRGFKVREGDIIPKKVIERLTKKNIFQGIKKRAEEMKFLEKTLETNIIPKQKFFDVYKEGFRKSKDEAEADRLVQLSIAAQRPKYTRDELNNMSIEELKNMLAERGYLTDTGIRPPRKEATATIPADPDEDRLIYNVYNNKLYKAFKVQQKLEKQGAITIQSAIRGKLAKNELNLKKEQLQAENKQKIEALTKIQNAAKNYIEKVRIKKEKDRVEAETKAELAKIDEDAKNALKREAGAATIQAAIRGKKGEQQYIKALDTAAAASRATKNAIKELEQAKQVRKQQAQAIKDEADVLQQELNALKRETGATTIQAALKGKRGQQQYKQALAFKKQADVAANELEQAKEIRKQQAQALKSEADDIQQEINSLKQETGATAIQSAFRGRKARQELGQRQLGSVISKNIKRLKGMRFVKDYTEVQKDIEEKQKQMKYPDEKEKLNIELNILQKQIDNIAKEREQLFIPEKPSSASLFGFFGGKKAQDKYDKELEEYDKKDAALANLQERYKKRISDIQTVIDAPKKQLATIIQSAVKRKQAKQIYKGMIDAEEQAKRQAEREIAATTLQSAVKRKQAKRQAEKEIAATTLQSAVKREQAKRQVEREIAATTLQSAVRGAIKDTKAKQIYKGLIEKEAAKAKKEAEYQTKLKLKRDLNTFNQIKNKSNIFFALKDMREKFAKWKDEYQDIYIKPLGYDDYFEKVVKDWIDETQAIIDERNKAERELAQQKKQEKIAAIQAKKEADAARREAQVAAFTSRPVITRTEAMKLTEEDKEAIKNIQNVKDFERLKAKYDAGYDKKLIIKELKKKYEKWKEEYTDVYFKPEGYEWSFEHTAWLFLKDIQNEYEREKEEKEEERKKSKVIVPRIGVTIRTRSPPRAATPSPPRAATRVATPSPPRAATRVATPSPPRAARNYSKEEIDAMSRDELRSFLDERGFITETGGLIRAPRKGVDPDEVRFAYNAWQRKNYQDLKSLAKSGKGLARLSKAKKAPKISPTERMKNRLRLVTSQVQAGNTNPKLIVEVNKLYKKLYNIDNAYSLLKK
jgi:hypothetical protein